jgi:hypothetical protein
VGGNPQPCPNDTVVKELYILLYHLESKIQGQVTLIYAVFARLAYSDKGTLDMRICDALLLRPLNPEKTRASFHKPSKFLKTRNE